MKKRILIVGSKGMAGHMIFFYLKSLGKYHIADLSYSGEHFTSTYRTDINDLPALRAQIEEERPDYLIYCLGILTKEADMNPDKAIFINSYLPHWLAKTAKELRFKLIQFSTDCEFSGSRGSYTETDRPDATDMYGRTKALGEVNRAPHLNIRTSFVGPELKENGIGLFNWFMHQSGIIKGYTHAIWTGVTTLELARNIDKAIDMDLSGLYQLVNGQSISKLELLEIFKKVFHREQVSIIADDSYSNDKSLVSARNELPVKGYQEMIDDMKTWMDAHKDLYTQYYSHA